MKFFYTLVVTSTFAAVFAGTIPTTAHADNYFCVGPVYGNETVWHGTRNAAKRAARRKWRTSVKNTAGLGEEFSVWGWAQHPDYHDGSDGYFCRTEHVWFDAWHKCAAWGEPCNYDPESEDVPRRGRTVSGLDLSLEEMTLEVHETELRAARVTREGTCPAAYILTAYVFGAGNRGQVQVNLSTSQGTEQTATLTSRDFRPSGDGRRVATVDFVRKFEGAVDRQYFLSAHERRSAPTRTNPQADRRDAPTRTNPQADRGDAPTRTNPQADRGDAPTRTNPQADRGDARTRTNPQAERGDTPRRTNPPYQRITVTCRTEGNNGLRVTPEERRD